MIKKNYIEATVIVTITLLSFFLFRFFDVMAQMYETSHDSPLKLDEYVLAFIVFSVLVYRSYKNQQLKHSLEKIFENERKRKIIESSLTDVLVVVNKNFKVIKVSPSVKEMTGYTQKEFKKINFSKFFAKESNEHIQKVMSSIAKKKKKYELVRHEGRDLEIITKSKQIISVEIVRTDVYDAKGEFEQITLTVRDVSKRVELERKLTELAITDPLTKLHNRKAFDNKIKASLEYAKRYKQTKVLLYLDLNKFKKVNDTLGHEVGDEVLIEAASRVKKEIRSTDDVFRLGGDEFVVLLNTPNTPDYMIVAKRICETLKKTYHFKYNSVDYVSTSIGISIYPKHASNPSELVKYADEAMYYAKKSNLGIYEYNENEIS